MFTSLLTKRIPTARFARLSASTLPTNLPVMMVPQLGANQTIQRGAFQRPSQLFQPGTMAFFHTDHRGHDAEEAEIVSEESSSTPFDDDYFATDKMPESEQEAILGISQLEEALHFFNLKKYDQAEVLLKEALKILKHAEQEKSMGYLYLLKRLAYVCFCNRKYSESEKYFKVMADLTPLVSQNPANIFTAKLNLLILYTHTDLVKAKEFGQRMITDLDEFLPVHSKDLHFMLGNIHFLAGDFDKSKAMFRQTLKMSPRPALEAQTLNNLAFCSWMHLLELPKLKAKLEGQTDEATGEELFEQEKQRILKEESYGLGYLRQSIELGEKAENKNLNYTLFEDLMTMDLEEEGVENLTEDQEQDFFTLIESKTVGKAVTNLSEYLLMTQAMKGEIKNAAFWFRLGLKYYERVIPEDIDRHLIMLALFYATRDKKMMAEGLYRQVLDKLEYDKDSASLNYNLVMALNFYGRMLMANPKRHKEAQDYIKQSEQIAEAMPYWYDKLDNIYLPKFDLD